MLTEKRRFTRIRFKMPAELTVNNQVFSFVQVDNLSVGGCLLEMDEFFDSGTPCRFWLPLEPVEPDLGVEAFGEIVRCEKGAVSIRFTSITPESLFHLHNIIRYNTHDLDRVDDEISKHPGLL
jgi:hypothetical protein